MSSWATVVYILSFITSAVCGWLLVRAYLANRTKLLLWSAGCFVLLAVNNLFVVIDMIVLPTQVDLSFARIALNLAAIVTLLYGFIWEID
jgi:hypothetical protein